MVRTTVTAIPVRHATTKTTVSQTRRREGLRLGRRTGSYMPDAPSTRVAVASGGLEGTVFVGHATTINEHSFDSRAQSRRRGTSERRTDSCAHHAGPATAY